jgi:hypothetical protein
MTDMRRHLKKLDWGYGLIATISIGTALFVTDIMSKEHPDLPGWYSWSSSAGVAMSETRRPNE